MSNDDHVGLLKRGAAAWNAWRAEHDEAPDLSRAGLRGVDLTDSAVFDEAENRWVLEFADRGRVAATYCIMATGCLSSANTPKFVGIDSFRGETYHTGHWPHEGVDFSGKCVGVIGTGSSAIQSIPMIARHAAQ